LNLKISLDKADKLLASRISAINNIRQDTYGVETGDLIRWITSTTTILEEIYGIEDKHVQQMKNVKVQSEATKEREAKQKLTVYQNLLMGYYDELQILTDNPSSSLIFTHNLKVGL
jgi:hypothetical protein